jgi:glycosyltransferase involved in cell wall biosynthesis
VVNASPAENSPLSMIEAITCGTPVVGFKVGGIPELVDGENGMLAEPRTPQALANALDDVLFRRQFDRSAIRERAKHHHPLNVLGEYRRVYTELAGN